MRLMLMGDGHGDVPAMLDGVQYAFSRGVSQIFHVGDFGFWPHTGRGRQFLQMTEEVCAENGIYLFWIDGNHENHDVIRNKCESGEWRETIEGFREVSPHVRYIPRGLRWTRGGLVFLGLGGAPSIDRSARIEGVTWWRDEETTYSDARRAIGEGDRVHVMLTHDAPYGVDVPGIDFSIFPEGDGNRKLLAEVAEELRPQLLVHGHYHTRYEKMSRLGPLHNGLVIGLDESQAGLRKQTQLLDVEDGVWRLVA